MVHDMYSEALLEHATTPYNRGSLSCATNTQQGINPECGDDLTLSLVLNNNVIADAAWSGTGCAISQGSADILCDLVRGKTFEHARKLIALFGRMIRGEEKDTVALSSLDEAVCLQNISHMPARVKCAELAWHTLNTMLDSTDDHKCDKNAGTEGTDVEAHDL